MPVNVLNFTTGPATLPDVGELSYNGCVFSPLFETSVSGNVVKDNAQRTTKLLEYTITADGYVTAPGALLEEAAQDAVVSSIASMRELLTAQGGSLTYTGRGCELVVNPAGRGGVRDVAWGPVPELLEFQPLGGGLSAKVKWQVKTRIPEIPGIGKKFNEPLLQFNCETAVTYNEDGYSSLSVRGTTEIPMTRTPDQKTRTLTQTVDDFRSILDARIFTGIDLDIFRVTRRNYSVSRDKRTMEFDIVAEERAYMDVPPDCVVARGTYSVRPAKVGMGLCLWLCTLRATYTVRGNQPRRIAWFAFLALLRLRMALSQQANVPPLKGDQNPGKAFLKILPQVFFPTFRIGDDIGEVWRRFFTAQNKQAGKRIYAFLLDLSFDEGLYLDSKTVTFSATWRLVTTISHILLASGLWECLPDFDAQGNNVWATSMRNVQGSRSWLLNKLDPNLDIIVDFGGD